MPKPGLRLDTAQEEELKEVYRISKAHKDPDMCLRIRGLFLVHRGNRESDAAEIIGVGRRTLQDWIHRYMDRGTTGLVKGPYPGGKSRLSDKQRGELSEIIAAGPEKGDFDTGVWQASMLVQLVKNRYGVSYSVSHMGRILGR